MEFWGYKKVSDTDQKFVKHFTTTKVDQIQLLGSHELYYWPGQKFLLVRLSDGTSFRMWRFAEDFEDVATGEAAKKIKERIT